ncbi:nicotinamide riboside transporter PnuC [Actinomadura sp. DC4]|uniref:nicotinamide riboside transporter PnuC n=1 Tax=Actinomadura sp. DC4 TaxID=3055069 RepID=UPI0025AFE879|nr:nicotinamide riboside transporter PnuC [Actinomadura sp. DC4]MDN3354503.1 nicotinamide riboside transporter PnuC [Actinomadura sp. DC4]
MSVHELLVHPAFSLGSTPTSWAEVLGFVTGGINVWLVVRQHIANWPVGIANVILLGLIFVDGGLYADAGLQVVYVVLQVWGWWQWLYGGRGRTQLATHRTSRTEWIAQAVAGVVATALLTWLLSAWTDSTVPFWDALTTTISLAATYGQSRKLLESWWLWIAADLIYIPLYAYKHLYLTSVLYVLFLGLCVAGLIAWRREWAGRRTSPVAA